MCVVLRVARQLAWPHHRWRASRASGGGIAPHASLVRVVAWCFSRAMRRGCARRGARRGGRSRSRGLPMVGRPSNPPGGDLLAHPRHGHCLAGRAPPTAGGVQDPVDFFIASASTCYVGASSGTSPRPSPSAWDSTSMCYVGAPSGTSLFPSLPAGGDLGVCLLSSQAVPRLVDSFLRLVVACTARWSAWGERGACGEG